MHPWHDVELGDETPAVVPAVIEIQRGSKAKYKIDRKTGLLRLDRILTTAARYPVNYGFMPRTLGTDGEALDILVMGLDPVPPLTILQVRPIGGIRIMNPEKGTEEKVISVFEGDPELAKVESMKDISRFRLDEIRQFFETYQQLNGPHVKVKGFFGKARAKQLIEEAMHRYEKSSVAA